MNEQSSMNKQEETDFLHFGIKSIDSQHQTFFNLLEELKSYNLNGENNEIKANVLNKFKDYTQYHFELEKRIMTRAKYNELESHIEQHAFFIKKIEEFEMAYHYQSASLSEQMLHFLQKWFLVHIQEWDQNYVDFINTSKNSDQ